MDMGTGVDLDMGTSLESDPTGSTTSTGIPPVSSNQVQGFLCPRLVSGCDVSNVLMYYKYPVTEQGAHPPSTIQPNVSSGIVRDRQRSRTIDAGSIPVGVTLSQVLHPVITGLVESAKLIESKRCAFISSLEEAPARTFF